MNDLKRIREELELPETMRLYHTKYYRVFVGIEDENKSKFVSVIAPLCVNKVKRMTWSYSNAFYDHEVLKDNCLNTYLSNAYGYK